MLPLQKGRILYECKGSGISSNKAYKVYEQYNKNEQVLFFETHQAEHIGT